jgi:hypothetical protein
MGPYSAPWTPPGHLRFPKNVLPFPGCPSVAHCKPLLTMGECVSAYLIIATVLPFTAHSILHLLELTALPPYSAVSIHSMVATVRYKVLNISVHPIYLFWIVLLHLTLIE